MMPLRTNASVLALAILAGLPAAAQEVWRPPLSLTGVPLLDDARRGQAAFEEFRREYLPPYHAQPSGGDRCAERVGHFCYWYDESMPPPPPEPAETHAERARLIALLDSAAVKHPNDDWVVGQRVRYLNEHGLRDSAIAAALACRAEQWWCSALVGFAYHESRQYVRADSAFTASLAAMPPRVRCDWSDIGILLDEYTLRGYRRTQCGTPERTRYENRMWWLAKPLYAKPGMDTRTEFFARMTMSRMIEHAPTVFQRGYDTDERELVLRYGWPRAWSRGGRMPGGNGEYIITGHEHIPAYQYLPPAILANSPAMSDSADWEDGVLPVHARYAPAYARRIRPLTHQSALFRRGDSAVVVLAWDATRQPLGKSIEREMALVLTRADSLKPIITRQANAPLRGVMMGHGPWGQILMSAELTAPGVDTAVRARYGVRPPYAIGARVTLSDMLFFTPYDGLPDRLEDAVPHTMSSIRVKEGDKIGVFFESYGTNPAGEELKVTLTVAREEDEPGFVRRRLRALKISTEASPVTLTHTDISARGQRMTARSFYLDVSKLKKGAYIVQLEVQVAGQYVVASEKSIEVY